MSESETIRVPQNVRATQTEEGRPPVAPTNPDSFLRPLRSLRLISESDYSYFVIFVPFVARSPEPRLFG